MLLKQLHSLFKDSLPFWPRNSLICAYFWSFTVSVALYDEFTRIWWQKFFKFRKVFFTHRDIRYSDTSNWQKRRKAPRWTDHFPSLFWNGRKTFCKNKSARLFWIEYQATDWLNFNNFCTKSVRSATRVKNTYENICSYGNVSDRQQKPKNQRFLQKLVVWVPFFPFFVSGLIGSCLGFALCLLLGVYWQTLIGNRYVNSWFFGKQTIPTENYCTNRLSKVGKYRNTITIASFLTVYNLKLKTFNTAFPV